MKHAAICLNLALHSFTAVALTVGLAVLGWATSSATLNLLFAAALFAARHKPAKAHPKIAVLTGNRIASWITGHKATPTQSAPADGPQIPAN